MVEAMSYHNTKTGIILLVVGLEIRRCEFKSRSRQRIFRCSLQCQINMNLDFHISEDGSEINLLLKTANFIRQKGSQCSLIHFSIVSYTNLTLPFTS